MKEALLIFIHSPVFVENVIIRIKNEEYYLELGLNQIICVIMLSRLYMIIKLFGRFSKFQTPKVVKIW